LKGPGLVRERRPASAHLADAEYPQALLQIADPPTLLYVRGRLDLLNKPALAVVGSRNPTPQGLQNAERFAAALAEAGLTIASGLALGIDAAAHRGALRTSGSTWLSSAPVSTVSTRPANQQLALEIAARGAIVSEFPLGVPPARRQLPAPQPADLRLLARCAGGRSDGRQRFADYRAPRLRTGTRGIRHSRIDSLATFARLPQVDQAGGQAGRNGRTSSTSSRWPARPGAACRGIGIGIGGERKISGLLQCMGFDPCSLDELVQR
jgi:hypothetical protein